MVNKDICAKILLSEVMWHKNCRRSLSDLTYPPCGFNEYGNNGDNSNNNHDDNNNDNNNDDNNGNVDNKHKNINNNNIHFCNIQ